MRITRRTALRSLAGATLAAAGAGAYGFGFGRRRFDVTRTVCPISSLPPGLSGLRIGLISDIHCGEFMPVEHVAEAAALLTRERPDLILVGGDHVTWADREALAPCVEGLATLSAPLGIFSVPGNHDPETALERVLGSAGIHVLLDEHVRVKKGRDTIALGGLRYWSQKTADVRRVFGGAPGFRILLAHDPRRLAQAAQVGVPLILSGHTHGGQVRLPLVGAPAAWRFPVVAGLASQGPSTLYVTRGLGTVVVPVRFNCRPEITVLTLRRG